MKFWLIASSNEVEQRVFFRMSDTAFKFIDLEIRTHMLYNNFCSETAGRRKT